MKERDGRREIVKERVNNERMKKRGKEGQREKETGQKRG